VTAETANCTVANNTDIIFGDAGIHDGGKVQSSAQTPGSV
jgi:hypothetical protein